MRVASWWNDFDRMLGPKGKAAMRMVEYLLLSLVLIGTKYVIKMAIHATVPDERLVEAFDAVADLCLILPAILIVGAGAVDVTVVVGRDVYNSITGKDGF